MRRVLARRLTIEGPREVGGDIEAGLLGVHAGPARDLQCRHFVADSSAEGGEGALLQQILGRAADDARGALCGSQASSEGKRGGHSRCVTSVPRWQVSGSQVALAAVAIMHLTTALFYIAFS